MPIESPIEIIDTQTLVKELIDRINLSNCLDFNREQWEELKTLIVLAPL